MSNTRLEQSRERRGLTIQQKESTNDERCDIYISVNPCKCEELDLQEFHPSRISKNKKRKNRLFIAVLYKLNERQIKINTQDKLLVILTLKE